MDSPAFEYCIEYEIFSDMEVREIITDKAVGLKLEDAGYLIASQLLDLTITQLQAALGRTDTAPILRIIEDVLAYAVLSEDPAYEEWVHEMLASVEPEAR